MLKVPISGICRPSPLVMPSWCHPGPGWPAPGPAPAVLRRKYAGASSGPDNCLPPQDVPTGRCEEAGVRQELPWLAGDDINVAPPVSPLTTGPSWPGLLPAPLADHRDLAGRPGLPDRAVDQVRRPV